MFLKLLNVFLFSEDNQYLRFRASCGFRGPAAHRPGPGSWRRRYRPDTPPPASSTTAEPRSRSPSPEAPSSPPPHTAPPPANQEEGNDTDVEVLEDDDDTQPDTPQERAIRERMEEIVRLARDEPLPTTNEEFGHLSIPDRFRAMLIDILYNLELFRRVCNECEVAGEQILRGDFISLLRRHQ